MIFKISFPLKISRWVALSILLLFFPCAFTDEHQDQTPIQSGINHLIHSLKQTAHIGVIVESLKTGKILFNKEGDYFFTPASIQKIITSAAGLIELKPSYQFKTDLYINGRIHQGILSGDITIKWGGDPDFKLSDLSSLLNHLSQLHVQKIIGHVNLDAPEYNSIIYPPGCLWDDLSYSYAAPINNIIINQNKFVISLEPSTVLGNRPFLEASLPPGVVHFINYLRTTENYQTDCPVAIYSDAFNHYRLQGCLPKIGGKQFRSLAVRNIEAFAHGLIMQQLRVLHIQLIGSIRPYSTPAHSQLIATHNSPPLSQIIHHLLKRSDNVETNAILLKVGEKYYKQPVSWQVCVKALKKIIQTQMNVDLGKGLITDGAGLSRYNLISPLELVHLLNAIYYQEQLRSYIFPALPIAGRDGTLAGRMIAQGKEQRIHAKTGTMTGVSSLAGYVLSKHHGPLAFVIIMNGLTGPRGPYVHLQNQICEFLVNAPSR